MVHMKQMFVFDEYCIQDEGRSCETLFVPFGLYILVKTLLPV